jgi:hypothetical protein
MRKLICCLIVALFCAEPLFAAKIVWVSFHGSDAPSANAASAGLLDAPDKPYTDLLTANGHTVTRFVTKDDPDATDLDVMNSSDLVILGRSVNSGNYESATETGFWNTQVTVPVICMGGYLLRSSRLNWHSGTTMTDTAATLGLLAGDPAHPVFSGIALDGSNNMVNPFANIVNEPLLSTPTQRGISVEMDSVAGGTVIATSLETGTTGGTIIAEWGLGALVNNGEVLAGPRMSFLSGSREASGISAETAGLYDLTADGASMFLNAVNYMAVPEPSTFCLAAFGLLGLIGFGRRKR